MNKRITELSAQIKVLEAELRQEIQKIRIRSYEIREQGVQFTEQALAEHRTRAVHVFQYLRRARLRNVLTVPVIWLCLVPALFLDLVVSLFQAICFPIYGIPKVRRKDHIVIDRHYLAYLNIIEKLNCLYCGYFNGLMAYVTEVAGRTEQYWCPIKHARQLKKAHDRYHRFTEFGDAEGYRSKVATVRRDFCDIENPD